MKFLLRVVQATYFHLVMATIWAVMLFPTLVWWKSSILWVAAMSLYANFVGHLGAYQARRAEKQAQAAESS